MVVHPKQCVVIQASIHCSSSLRKAPSTSYNKPYHLSNHHHVIPHWLDADGRDLPHWPHSYRWRISHGPHTTPNSSRSIHRNAIYSHNPFSTRVYDQMHIHLLPPHAQDSNQTRPPLTQSVIIDTTDNHQETLRVKVLVNSQFHRRRWVHINL